MFKEKVTLSPHLSLNFSKNELFPLISDFLNTRVDTQVHTWLYVCVLRREQKNTSSLTRADTWPL